MKNDRLIQDIRFNDIDVLAFRFTRERHESILCGLKIGSPALTGVFFAFLFKFKVFQMNKIDRKELAASEVAGGCCKCCCSKPASEVNVK